MAHAWCQLQPHLTAGAGAGARHHPCGSKVPPATVRSTGRDLPNRAKLNQKPSPAFACLHYPSTRGNLPTHQLCHSRHRSRMSPHCGHEVTRVTAASGSGVTATWSPAGAAPGSRRDPATRAGPSPCPCHGRSHRSSPLRWGGRRQDALYHECFSQMMLWESSAVLLGAGAVAQPGCLQGLGDTRGPAPSPLVGPSSCMGLGDIF